MPLNGTLKLSARELWQHIDAEFFVAGVLVDQVEELVHSGCVIWPKLEFVHQLLPRFLGRIWGAVESTFDQCLQRLGARRTFCRIVLCCLPNDCAPRSFARYKRNV